MLTSGCRRPKENLETEREGLEGRTEIHFLELKKKKDNRLSLKGPRHQAEDTRKTLPCLAHHRETKHKRSVKSSPEERHIKEQEPSVVLSCSGGEIQSIKGTRSHDSRAVTAGGPWGLGMQQTPWSGRS